MYKLGIIVMIILLIAILYIQYDIIQGFTDISDVSGILAPVLPVAPVTPVAPITPITPVAPITPVTPVAPVQNNSIPLLQNIIDILSSYKLSKDASGNCLGNDKKDKTTSDADKLTETTKLIKDLNETLKSDKIKDRLDSSVDAKKTKTVGGVSTTIGTGGGLTGTNTMCSFPAPTCESPIVPVSGATTDCLQQGSEMNKAPIDMSQYVRKDSIPCWGCNLDY